MESRNTYYQRMKALAGEVRDRYGLSSTRVQVSDLRRIFRAECVRVDLWDRFSPRLRGAYFNDASGPTVVVNKRLPTDPRVFTMAHELKHHLVDSDQALAVCDPSTEQAVIEIGAEVFAAELLFAEERFLDHFESHACTPEAIVHLKRGTQTTLSYTGIAKLAIRLRLVPVGRLDGIRWKKLEESLYGVPFYRHPARRRYREGAVRAFRASNV